MDMARTRTERVETKVELANPGSNGKAEGARGLREGMIKASRVPGKTYGDSSAESMANFGSKQRNSMGNPRIRDKA